MRRPRGPVLLSAVAAAVATCRGARGAGYIDCASHGDVLLGEAWADLRQRFERLIRHDQLPDIIFGTAKIVLRWESERGASPSPVHWNIDFLQPIGAHGDCPVGRWACWLAQQEPWRRRGWDESVYGQRPSTWYHCRRPEHSFSCSGEALFV